MATGKRVFLTRADRASLQLVPLGLLSAAFVLFTAPIHAQSVDPSGVVQSFLPQKAQLRTVESADLNGDQIPEIVASYKIESLPYNEVTATVLQRKVGRWEKIWKTNISWGNSAVELKSGHIY